MTAIASLSNLVQKPTVKVMQFLFFFLFCGFSYQLLEFCDQVRVYLSLAQVSPELGLEVSLSGSGATGSQPTTLSPTILMVAWRCIVLYIVFGLKNTHLSVCLPVVVL